MKTLKKLIQNNKFVKYGQTALDKRESKQF